jgi:hypothetical protein
MSISLPIDAMPFASQNLVRPEFLANLLAPHGPEGVMGTVSPYGDRGATQVREKRRVDLFHQRFAKFVRLASRSFGTTRIGDVAAVNLKTLDFSLLSEFLVGTRDRDDAFVARSDLKLDRSSNTLVVCGIWFEDRKTAINQSFNDALLKGIARLMRFIGATTLDSSAVEPRSVRRLLSPFNAQREQGSAAKS